MSSLQKLNEDLSFQWPVAGRNLESMPSNFSQAISIDYFINTRINIGLMAGYSSTGSRIYYADYSGTLVSDFNLFRYDLAAETSFYLEKSFGIYPFFKVQGGVAFTKLQIESLADIGFARKDITEFSSLSPITRIGLGLEKRVSFLVLKLTSLYEVDLESKMKWKENNDFYLLDSFGNEIDSNWGGFKIIATVGLKF